VEALASERQDLQQQVQAYKARDLSQRGTGLTSPPPGSPQDATP